MDGLEELLAAHVPEWDPQVVERRRYAIGRRIRAYKDSLGVGPATVRAYAEVAEPPVERDWPESTECPAAATGCASCPGADS